MFVELFMNAVPLCRFNVTTLINYNNFIFVIVTCAIMQKNGAGLHMRHACYWDRTNDNTVVAKWPSEKKKDPNAKVVCIVTVFGIAY